MSAAPLRRLARLVRRPAAQRHFLRHSCTLDAYLVLEGQQYEVKGVILDISRQGVLFRPRSDYIMKLQKVSVELHVGTLDMYGEVVNTIPRGYGLQFHDLLDQPVIDALCRDAAEAPARA